MQVVSVGSGKSSDTWRRARTGLFQAARRLDERETWGLQISMDVVASVGEDQEKAQEAADSHELSRSLSCSWLYLWNRISKRKMQHTRSGCLRWQDVGSGIRSKATGRVLLGDLRRLANVRLRLQTVPTQSQSERNISPQSQSQPFPM